MEPTSDSVRECVYRSQFPSWTILQHFLTWFWYFFFEGFMWTKSLSECLKTIQALGWIILPKQWVWWEVYGVTQLGQPMGSKLTGLKHPLWLTFRDSILMAAWKTSTVLVNVILPTIGGMDRGTWDWTRLKSSLMRRWDVNIWLTAIVLIGEAFTQNAQGEH